MQPGGALAAPKSALTSSLSLGARLMPAMHPPGAKAVPFALPGAPSGADRGSNRSTSAPSELSNISCGSAAPGGGAGLPKGSWRMSLALADFLLGGKLGEGLTGRVHYAKLKVRGAECALKVMRKSKLVELGEEHHVRSELDALDRIASPFITALLGCFQDAQAVYLAIEYMRGPDLFAYMCAAAAERMACARAHALTRFAPTGTRSTRQRALSAACPSTPCASTPPRRACVRLH